MREASDGGTVTDTDSYAFSFNILMPTRGRPRQENEMRRSIILLLTVIFQYLIVTSAVICGDDYFNNTMGEYVVENDVYYRIDIAYTDIFGQAELDTIKKYENICFVVAHPQGYSGDVVIPEEIEYKGTNYTVIGSYVTEIKGFYGDYDKQTIFCFKGCDKLKSITLPSTFKYLYLGFYGCTSLEVINIPDLVISDIYQLKVMSLK